MGKRDRREMRSQAIVLIMHLMKWAYQPDRREGSTRLSTINEQRREIELNLADSPSLNDLIPRDWHGCIERHDARLFRRWRSR